MPWQIVKKTFQFIWHNKKLWLIGIFASFLGNLEEIEILRSFFYPQVQANTLEFWNQLQNTRFFTRQGIQGMFKLAQTQPLTLGQVFFFMALLLIAGVFIFWLSLVSQAALIYSVKYSSLISQLRTSEIIKKTRKKFWPVFFVNFFSRVTFFFLFWVLGSLLLPSSRYLQLLMFIIMVAMYLIFSFFFKYTVCGIIIKNFNLTRSLKRAIAMMRSYWKYFLELALLLFLFFFISIILYPLVVAVLTIPFATIFIAGVFLKIPLIIALVPYLFLIFAAIAFFIIHGILSALSWGSWAHMFIELEKNTHS